MSTGNYYRVVVFLAAALTFPCLADDMEWTDDRAVQMADGVPGDPAYGEYLAQECASCHFAEGAGNVPPIAGIAPGYFREAMAEYTGGIRDNAAMASVARSLDDEQLAALAAWFATQQKDQ